MHWTDRHTDWYEWRERMIGWKSDSLILTEHSPFQNTVQPRHIHLFIHLPSSIYEGKPASGLSVSPKQLTPCGPNFSLYASCTSPSTGPKQLLMQPLSARCTLRSSPVCHRPPKISLHHQRKNSHDNIPGKHLKRGAPAAQDLSTLTVVGKIDKLH